MSQVNSVVAKKLEERACAKRDRLFLATEVLGFDFDKDTHEELFAQYPTITEVDEGHPWVRQFIKRDVLVLWPRGHFKTTALVVIIIQAILNFPDIRILLMQGSVPVTQTLLKQVASHFDGTAVHSRFKELFPEFCGTKKELQLTKMFFTTPARRLKQLAQATVTVASPKSVKTGQHYDLGIFDDLVNDQNYDKPEKLADIETKFNDCQPLIDPGCPRFVSGTRYAFGDLYENIIRRDAGRDEWIISVKTCWKDGLNPDSGVRFPQRQTKYGKIVGFTREGLLQILRDTPALFSSQYLNRPASEAFQVLTEADFTTATILPNLTPALSEAVLFIDTAQEGDHPDDSVIVAGRVDPLGRQYCTDIRGGQFTIPELALHVIDMALKHRPWKVMIEKSQAAVPFVHYLQMVCKDKGIVLPVDYIKVDNRKDAKNIRVQAMAGNIKSKRLFFFGGLPNWQKLIDQAIQFPKGKYGHDDYPDTVALMSQFFASNYIGVAPHIPRSKNPMIAILDRDPVSQEIVLNDSETVTQNGTMGDDFA